MSEDRYEALRTELFWDAFWHIVPFAVVASVVTFLLVLIALKGNKPSRD
jgi:ABC-type multidrug transport system permease subunit